MDWNHCWLEVCWNPPIESTLNEGGCLEGCEHETLPLSVSFDCFLRGQTSVPTVCCVPSSPVVPPTARLDTPSIDSGSWAHNLSTLVQHQDWEMDVEMEPVDVHCDDQEEDEEDAAQSVGGGRRRCHRRLVATLDRHCTLVVAAPLLKIHPATPPRRILSPSPPTSSQSSDATDIWRSLEAVLIILPSANSILRRGNSAIFSLLVLSEIRL